MAGDQVRIANLKGGPAVLVLAALIAFGAWRVYAARVALDTDARERIEEQLEARYLRGALADVGGGIPNGEQVEALLRSGRVEIQSLSARGTPGDVVVRVEATVDGQPPPDGEPVTYWRMSYSTVAGWRVERATTALSWWLAWL